jgi:hypothetical protein
VSLRAKTIWIVGVAALLAAGCDARSGSGGSGVPESGASDPALANALLNPEEAARLRAQAVAALAGVLPGAAGAAYINVRSGSAGAICGEVDAGDALGRRPFVVTPTGAAMLSPTPELRLEDPNDPFPDLYMQYCASTDELMRLSERMERVRPSDAPPSPLGGGETSLPGDDAVAADGAEEPPPAPQGPGQRPPADNSFFNSVLRTPRSGTPPG